MTYLEWNLKQPRFWIYKDHSRSYTVEDTLDEIGARKKITVHSEGDALKIAQLLEERNKVMDIAINIVYEELDYFNAPGITHENLAAERIAARLKELKVS